MAEGEVDEERAATRRRIGIGAALAGGVAAVALLAGWIEREPIVTHFVDGKLVGARVPASYHIAAIGPFLQRLEAVRIGDPTAPDLVARSIELELGYGVRGPYFRAVRAEGVRLSGRVVDGRFSLGAIDRLLPKPSGKAPLKLPDIDVTLRDSRVVVETPAGVVSAAVEGQGLLSNGFHGRMTIAAPRLVAKGCAIRGLAGDIRIAVRDGRPEMRGPIDMAALACPSSGAVLGKGRGTLDLRLAPSLDRGRGGVALTGFGGRVGAGRFDAMEGLLTVAGNQRQMLGTVGLSAANLSAPSIRAGKGMLGGAFRIVPAAKALSFAGDLALRDLAVDPVARRRLGVFATEMAATPVGPITRHVGDATDRLLTHADADARISLILGGQTGSSIEMQRLALTGRSGGFLRIEKQGGLGWRARDGAWRVDGRMTTGGDGLPAFDVRVEQPRMGEAASGVARLEPYQIGGARLALSPLRFVVADGRARFAGGVLLDGPLGSGRVEGLALPLVGRIDRRGGFAIGEGCTPLGFRDVTIGGLALRPGRIALCGQGGAPLVSRGADGAVRFGAVASAIRLAGRSGEAGLSIAADRAEISAHGVSLRKLALRLGEGDALTRLDVDSIDGRVASGGLVGPFVGASARIGHVPLLLSNLSGDWQFADGTLKLKGHIGLADSAPSARFAPLLAQEAVLSVANGRIDAAATLREPKTGTAIADVTIAHDLASGTGHALLDVGGISFAPKHLQPEALTPLTLGVIANVSGTVAGKGRIDWNAKGVTSSGRFHTDGIDLAAAFGPVTKLSGTITFSDLLGLATPPHQEVRIAEVNPGVAVSNGIVHYQLLGEQRVAVEEARWPFAGGDLTLEPTVLSFAQAAERHLTFRVKGLDAAAFVQQLAFPNISATGTFDGVLPMIFDQSGGRIEGGKLIARQAGGSLAYVGDLSNAQLGMAGKLAFDALKAIRYGSLSIDLDGRLDGEIISSVKFDGVRQATGDKALAARMIRDLPFRFNIRIRAPFRGLLGSARAFADPSILLESGAPIPIQPAESETMR